MTGANQAATSAAGWPFKSCPDCGNGDFMTGVDDGTVIFTCLGCAASWHYLLGYLIPAGADGRLKR